MKILHVTNYDNLGGAGISAHRLHTALRKAGVDSRMLVRTKGSNDPFVIEIGDQKLDIITSKVYRLKPIVLNSRLAVRTRGWLGAKLTRALGMEGCSLNIFATGLHKILNASDADVIHLHWINNEMISIKEVSRIKKPVVWTLHDCWPFLGAEHHSTDSYWQCAETVERLPTAMFCASGAMPLRIINGWIFRLKMRAWKGLDACFVAPGSWMAGQVRMSRLFAEAPVVVIPNCVDLDIFKPINREECRRKWALPQDKQLLLFGAYSPMDPNKGLDLLEEALGKLRGTVRTNLAVVVFGCDGNREISGLETYWLGKISNDREMAEIYSAADLTSMPSRKESFGLIAAESLACGVPVAAFCTSGLADVVEHRATGWLAEPYDTDDFCRGISWILDEKQAPDAGCLMKRICREKAELMFSPEVVAKNYVGVYQGLTLKHVLQES